MRHGSLFSGIGGFDLAAEWMGWENVFHCEINPFGQKVLKHYWPDAIQYSDITKTDFTKHENTIDIISGGFPCQPFSNAGEQQGGNDERYLFPEMLRAIREIKPRWIVAENVRGIVTKKFEPIYNEIQASLETEGYETLPLLIPVTAVGADHERYRVWFVAYSHRFMLERISEQYGKPNPNGRRRETPDQVSSYTSIGRLFGRRDYRDIFRGDGIPQGLDIETIPFGKFKKESIKAFGNSIHPRLAYEIFKAIEAFENKRS